MKFRHSIQWRIFAYYSTLITVAVVVLATGFYFYEKQARVRLTKLNLQSKLVGVIPFYFAPQIGQNKRNGPPGARNGPPGARNGPPGMRNGPPKNFRHGGPPMRFSADASTRRLEKSKQREVALARHLDGLSSEHIYLYAADSEGKQLLLTDNFPAALVPAKGEVLEGENWIFVETAEHIYTNHIFPSRGMMIIGISQTALIAGLHKFLLQVIAVGMLVVAITSAVGFWIIHFALRPIKAISQTAARIATGDVSDRIDTRAVDSELGQLADTLNRTFARLGEALKRQIQFTSDASHELRTPVAAILADCQFSLKRERSPERYRETIEVCHESAQHMRSLIEDLRDLATFDEKNESLVSEQVDMREFLQNVLNVMTPLASEKGLDLDSELESAMIEIDPMRMRQAVINLIGNAIRYTETGGRIFVRCFKQMNSIVMEVRDTGMGIPANKLEHVFDRFFRADDARNSHTGGVGLGLAISKSIVEANDGAISVQSEEGIGTCFRIELALAG